MHVIQNCVIRHTTNPLTRLSELSAKISTHPITALPREAFACEATKVVVACMPAILTVWRINYNHPHNWLISEDILAIQYSSTRH